MIVSAPASAAVPVPLVPLASPDSKNSAVSKTSLFKNVFDRLTQFEDLQNEDGPGQESAAAPKQPTKKELSSDSVSGSEQTAVLLPLSPILPNPSFLSQQVAILPQSAAAAVPDHKANVEKEAPALQLASSGDQTDVGLLLKPSLTAPGSPQPPSPSSASAVPAPAVSVRYPLLASPLPPGTAGLEMATVALIRQALSTTPAATTAAVPDTTATPAKAQVKGSPFEPESLGTASSVSTSASLSTSSNVSAYSNVSTSSNSSTSSNIELEAAQTPVPSTSDPAGTALTISKPLEAKPVSAPALVAAEQVPAKPAGEEAIQRWAAQPGTTQVGKAPEATGLRVRESAPVTEPSRNLSTGSVKAPVNASSLIESALPANNSFQAVLTPQAASGEKRTSPQVGPSAAAISAPLPMSDARSNSAPEPAPPLKSVQEATPANAQVDRQITSTPKSTVPASTASPAEKQPDPAPAATVVASTSLPPPLPADHEVMDRAPEASSPSVDQHEALAVTPAPKIPLLPEAGNFAFAIRMLGLESASSHSSLTDSNATDSKAPVTTSDTPVTQIALTQTKGPAIQSPASNLQQPEPPSNQASSGQQRETQPAAVESEKPDTGTQNQPDLVKTQLAPGIVPHWNDAAVLQAPEIGSSAPASEPVEAARPNLPLAAQETHFTTPELPRTSSNSEILLHLTGNDESSAAIRVADRAGSVNVSVHASDPVLRESLRSNLGELSTQLNAQGWKADVVKSAGVATHSESQQDSQAGGQRGSQQQQSSGGERQPQRDRRANGGQWQQELDQQTTGGDALPGGNG